MAIYDVLKSNPSGAELNIVIPGAVSPPNSIQLTHTGPSIPFVSVNGNSWFETGDNILIQNIWIRVPYGFGQADDATEFQLNWDENTGLFNLPVDEMANGSGVFFPDICRNLEVQDQPAIFAAHPNNGVRARLGLTRMNLDISLINTPAALLGDTVQVEVMMLVKHTLPLANGF